MNRARLTQALFGAAILASCFLVATLLVSSRQSNSANAAPPVTTTAPTVQTTDSVPGTEVGGGELVSSAIVPVETTTSTTSTTTTTIPEPETCAGERYELVVPLNWSASGCDSFSEGPFPDASAEREFRPEIDVSFTTSETYAEALARIQSDETVLSNNPTIVDGLLARRLVLREEWWEVGERTVVVVDAGDGVFFASANKLVDINAPTEMTLNDRYAQTLRVFGDMLSELRIDEVATPCEAPTLSNPTQIRRGLADVDGDGIRETMRLLQHDDGLVMTVDVLEQGVAWGPVGAIHVEGLDRFGWHDWDADGLPEIIVQEPGPPSGDLFGTYTIHGCALVPAVDINGHQTYLLASASGRTANSYRCNWSEDGSYFELQVVATTFVDDADAGSTPEHRVSKWSYDNGVFVRRSQVTTSISLGSGVGGLASCTISTF